MIANKLRTSSLFKILLNMKFRIIILFFFIGFSSSMAQSNTDFPSSNAIWSEIYQPPYLISTSPEPIIHAIFEEDTIIENRLYSKLFKISDTVDVQNNSEYIGELY